MRERAIVRAALSRRDACGGLGWGYAEVPSEVQSNELSRDCRKAEPRSRRLFTETHEKTRSTHAHRDARRFGCSPRRASSAMGPFFGGRGGRAGRGAGFTPKPPADPYAKIAELAKLTCETPPFGTPAPDAELMRALKREVRRDQAAMDRVHDALLRALQHEECGPRMHAVAVIDQLFHRSQHFRSLAVDTLDVFLKRAVGVDPDAHPLPGPAPETRHLIDRAVAALESWTATFGANHPRLALAVGFANDALGPDAPSARAAEAARIARVQTRRENATLLVRWRRIEADLPRLTRQARETVAEMRAGVRAVLGGDAAAGDAAAGAAAPGEDDWEDVPDSAAVSFSSAALGGATARPDVKTETGSTIKVLETPTNAPLLASLRNACRVARGRCVPGLAAALALLAKITPEEEIGEAGVAAAFRAAAMNDLAALKREVLEGLERCGAIGVDEVRRNETNDADPWENDDEKEKNPAPDGEGTRVGSGNASGESRFLFAARIAAADAAEETPGALPETHGDGGSRETGGGSDLDELLDRARRRRRGRDANSGDHRARPRDPRAPFWMGRVSGTAAPSSSARVSGVDAGVGSVSARARRIFASREASAHNAAVMRELGESGVERRDGVSGFSDRIRARERARADEDSARAYAEAEAREAKRKRNEPTSRQRIEAKLRRMKSSNRHGGKR